MLVADDRFVWITRFVSKEYCTVLRQNKAVVQFATRSGTWECISVDVNGVAVFE